MKKIIIAAVALILVATGVFQWKKSSDIVKRYEKMEVLVSQSGIRFDYVEPALAPMVCAAGTTNLVRLEQLQKLISKTMEETGFPPLPTIVRTKEGFAARNNGRYTLLTPGFSPTNGYHLAQYGRKEPVFFRISM